MPKVPTPLRRLLAPAIRPARVCARGARAVLRSALPSRLQRWLALRRGPTAINLELTTECNLACPLCPTHVLGREGKMLKDEHVDQVLKGTRSLRTACLHVFGEPLLHPRVGEVVARLEGAGVATHFGTNGMELERHAESLVDAGLSSISIAIDGTDQDTYARYRKGGQLDRVLAGVRAVVAARDRSPGGRPRVQLQAIAFPYLEDRLDEVRAFLGELGPDSVVVKEPSLFVDDEAWAKVEGERLRGGAKGRRVESSAKRARAFVDSLGESAGSAAHARDREGRRRMRDAKLCPQLSKAHVLSDGRVVSCGMDALGENTIGHLRESTLQEIWRSPARRQLLQDFQERRVRLCSMCTL